MRYRGENLVENSVNEGYREGYRQRRLEIALVLVWESSGCSDSMHCSSTVASWSRS
jgi:hypothetical protein